MRSRRRRARSSCETRPGFVFIQGHWDRGGGRWEWRDGYWERERAGYVWEEGRWENRGRRHVWVEGRWRAGRRGPAVRDHREEHREERHETARSFATTGTDGIVTA